MKSKTAKVKHQLTLRVVDLQRLQFCNSPRMPKTVNDEGRRKRWVGIGWVDEGPADGSEDAKVQR